MNPWRALDPSWRPPLKEMTRFERQLYAAARDGYYCIDLLRAKADPNSATEDGDTPLMAAATQGHGECVQQLLAGGADPAMTDKDGKTARDRANDQDYVHRSRNSPYTTAYDEAARKAEKELLRQGGFYLAHVDAWPVRTPLTEAERRRMAEEEEVRRRDRESAGYFAFKEEKAAQEIRDTQSAQHRQYIDNLASTPYWQH